MIRKYFQRFVRSVDSPQRVLRAQRAFLPAALEIQETPPSPIGRAISWAIMVLFLIALLWACLGELDIVAVAAGKVIPSGRVKTIQPLDKGVVVLIHVEEGQSVHQGDPLVTLDGTETAADEARLAEDLHSAQTEWLRTRAFGLLLEAEQEDVNLSSDTAIQQAIAELSLALTPQEAVFQAGLLQAEHDEYAARSHGLRSQRQAREGEYRGALSLKRKLERTLPLIAERADSVKTLYAKSLVSREQHLALEQERITQEQDLLAQSARVEELVDEVEAVKQQVTALNAEYRRNNLIALMEAKKQSMALQQEWIKAQQRHRQQILHAPIAGTVQQLAIHTIGGVVTPAQELMLIVPQQRSLEVEAFIQNKDIGFVAEGQKAEVKVDTFNFTKYGTIDARLKTISNDAVADEKIGLVYPAKVVLETTRIKIADKWVHLSPGMAVTVEVKTGKRRVIEYFLSPLLRSKQESIRER